MVIDELARLTYTDPQTGSLADPLNIEQWPNLYFDNNADNRISALDALIVLNTLAADQASGEGELMPVLEDSKNIEDQISPVDQAILTWSIRDDSRILDDYSCSLDF